MYLRREKCVNIWSVLEKIRVIMDAGHDQFADFLELTAKDYWKLRYSQQMPSANSIFKLLERIPVSFEALMSGNIDFNALRTQLEMGEPSLPEKYKQASHSRVRTLQAVLQYLEYHHGWAASENLIKNFQIPPQLLQNPDAKVNIRLIADVYDYVTRYYAHPGQIERIGALSYQINQRSPIGRVLSKEKTVVKAYEVTFGQLMPHFDENFHYSIQAMDQSVVKVSVEQNSIVAEALGLRHLSNVQGCGIRGAVGGSFSAYLGVSHSAFRETKCVHRGDAQCLYEFDIEKSERELKAKLKQLEPSLQAY